MPGPRATLRDTPEHVLDDLEREGLPNMELLREIVLRVCRLGKCQVGDANNTRALAVNSISDSEKATSQFFTVLTDAHKGFHPSVGPLGFSIQASFRKQTIQPESADWKNVGLIKPNCTWWNNDLDRDGSPDINAIITVIACARASFLLYE